MKSSSCTSLVFIQISLRVVPPCEGGAEGVSPRNHGLVRFRDDCPPRNCRVGPTYWLCLLTPPLPPFSRGGRSDDAQQKHTS